MYQLGKIINHDGELLTIEFDEEINAEYLKTLSRGKENIVQVKLIDNDPLSTKQNALSHVLIRDIANWYGDVPERVESMLKYEYEYMNDEPFSHMLASKNEGNVWITMLIQFIIREGVQLKKRYAYLLEQDSFFYYSCKYRKCCVCGATGAQIHHVEAVGNRNRNKVDHRLFPFASVCFKHHQIAHNLGQLEFLSKYKVTPVFLDREALIKIGITSNAQLLRFDEEYETQELYDKAIEIKRKAIENGV